VARTHGFGWEAAPPRATLLYLGKLAEGGILSFHISNSFLDLEPVIASLAGSRSLTARVRMDEELTPAELQLGKTPSRWAIMARRLEDLGPIGSDPRWRTPVSEDDQDAWTDDFSDPLRRIIWH
jgi:hypothetical protein